MIFIKLKQHKILVKKISITDSLRSAILASFVSSLQKESRDVRFSAIYD